MSYFIDMSEDHPLTPMICSEFRRQNVDLGKGHEIDLKINEGDVFAFIVGIKPANTCKLDDGCTLDKALRLGICHFSGILTLVFFENGKIAGEVLSAVKTKLESKGFFVPPIGQEVVGTACFQEAISEYRQLFIDNELSTKDFSERKVFREWVHKTVLKKWNRFFQSTDGKALEKALKKA